VTGTLVTDLVTERGEPAATEGHDNEQGHAKARSEGHERGWRAAEGYKGHLSSNPTATANVMSPDIVPCLGWFWRSWFEAARLVVAAGVDARLTTRSCLTN
jgi:hypothetical protein